MPKLILNGKEYANNKPDGYPPLIYSDEEREVGVWRDGKPLYQKTYRLASPLSVPTNSWVDTDIPNTGMQKIIFGFGNDEFDNGSVLQSNSFMYLSFAVNAQNYVRVLNSRNATITLNYITLQYTKTTDIPGSGKWTTQGTPTHHYSENEHIIGTWIDGKPLYEKTITGGSASGDTGIDLTLLNIDQFIGVDSGATYAKRADNSVLITLNFNAPKGATYGWTIEYNKSNNYLYIGLKSFALTEYSITIRYTKTTD